MHAGAFVVALPAGVVLLVAARTAAARATGAVYAASLLLLFGTSAAYHVLARSAPARARMQRADHAMIFVLIAGTYTPVCLLALPLAWGVPVLAVVGAGAVTGVVLKLVAFDRLPRVAHALYLLLGWTALMATPALVTHLRPTQLAFIVAGGVVYTAGVPVLLFRRPDPWPLRFGYHEIWHACTIAAAAFQFVGVASIITGAAAA